VTDISAVDPARVAADAANPEVAEVMRDEVVFCLPSTPLDAVAKLMADNALVEIPVLIDQRPIGYVRSADVLDQLVEGNLQLSGSDLVRQQHVSVLARDILRTPPLLVDEHTQLGEALAVMRQQGRQTALVTRDDERPVGLLTVREIAAHALRQGGVADG
jgi:predicted transcriptional regulator